MSDVRKVISFTAVDAGVSAMFDKARQASAKYTAAVIEDAKKATAAINQGNKQQPPSYIQRFESARGFVDDYQGGNKRSMTGLSQPEKESVRNEFARRRLQARLNGQHEVAMADLNEKFYGTSGGRGAVPPTATLISEGEDYGNDGRNDKRQGWRAGAIARRRRAATQVANGVAPPPGFENTGVGISGFNPNKPDDGERFSFTHEEARAGQRVPSEKSASIVAEGHEKEKSQVEQMADDLVSEALAFSDDVKEQTKYIRDKIKDIRQEYAQDLQQSLVDNDKRRDSALAAAGDDKDKIKAANDEYKGRNQDIRKGQREDNLQVKLLQGIIDAVHQSAVVQTEAEKRNTEELVEEHNETQEQQAEEDKEDDAEEDTAPEYDAGGKKSRGFFGTLFGRVDDDYADDNEEDGAEGEDGDGDGKKGKKKKKGSRLVGAGLASQSSGALLSATGFAAFASIGGIIAKLIHEGGELEKTGGRMRGMTGIGYEDYNMKGGTEGALGIGKSADYGVKRADFVAYSTDLAQKRGYATAGYDASGRRFNSGLEGETNKLMSTEIGLGLSSGYLSGLGKHQSYDTNNRETSGDVQNLIKIMGSSGQFRGGDFSRLAELLETSNQIAEDQSGYLEQINSDKNAGIMAGVSRLGGSFADQRMGARISTLQGALRTPDNDFKQADAYAVLRRQNPHKSFFELQEEQEKGLGATGYMAGTMKDIMGRSGSDDFKRQMVKSRFGLSASQSRRLYDGYKANPDVFNFDQYTKAAGGADMDMVGRAKMVTPAIPIGLAKMDDVAAKAGDKTIKVLADMAKYVEDKVPAIVDGMKTMGDAASGVARKLDGLGSRAEKLMTKFENMTHWGD